MRSGFLEYSSLFSENILTVLYKYKFNKLIKINAHNLKFFKTLRGGGGVRIEILLDQIVLWS